MMSDWEIFVHHINVGAGDSALVCVKHARNSTLNRAILIDGGIQGAFTARVFPLVQAKISSDLSRNPAYLDAIVVTHYDQDHVEGIKYLFQQANLGNNEYEALLGFPHVPHHKVRLYDIGPKATGKSPLTGSEAKVDLLYMNYVHSVSKLAHQGKLEHIVPPLQAEKFQYPDDPLSIQEIQCSLQDLKDSIARSTLPTPLFPTSLLPQTVYFVYATEKKNQNPNTSQYECGFLFYRTDQQSTVTCSAHFLSIYTCPKTSRGKKNLPSWNRILFPYTQNPNSYNKLEGVLYKRLKTLISRPSKPLGNFKQEILNALNINITSTTSLSDLNGLISYEVLWGASPPPLQHPRLDVVALNASYWENYPHPHSPIQNSGPNTGNSKVTVINQRSLVLLLKDEAGTIFHYLAGDLDDKHEEFLLQLLTPNHLPQLPLIKNPSNTQQPRLPYFKLSHHGSMHSTPETLLAQWKPVFGVISAGNKHEHPHTGLIKRVADAADAKNYLTTLCAMCYPYYLSDYNLWKSSLHAFPPEEIMKVMPPPPSGSKRPRRSPSPMLAYNFNAFSVEDQNSIVRSVDIHYNTGTINELKKQIQKGELTSTYTFSCNTPPSTLQTYTYTHSFKTARIPRSLTARLTSPSNSPLPFITGAEDSGLNHYICTLPDKGLSLSPSGVLLNPTLVTWCQQVNLTGLTFKGLVLDNTRSTIKNLNFTLSASFQLPQQDSDHQNDPILLEGRYVDGYGIWLTLAHEPLVQPSIEVSNLAERLSYLTSSSALMHFLGQNKSLHPETGDIQIGLHLSAADLWQWCYTVGGSLQHQPLNISNFDQSSTFLSLNNLSLSFHTTVFIQNTDQVSELTTCSFNATAKSTWLDSLLGSLGVEITGTLSPHGAGSIDLCLEHDGLSSSLPDLLTTTVSQAFHEPEDKPDIPNFENDCDVFKKFFQVIPNTVHLRFQFEYHPYPHVYGLSLHFSYSHHGRPFSWRTDLNALMFYGDLCSDLESPYSVSHIVNTILPPSISFGGKLTNLLNYFCPQPVTTHAVHVRLNPEHKYCHLEMILKDKWNWTPLQHLPTPVFDISLTIGFSEQNQGAAFTARFSGKIFLDERDAAKEANPHMAELYGASAWHIEDEKQDSITALDRIPPTLDFQCDYRQDENSDQWIIYVPICYQSFIDLPFFGLKNKRLPASPLTSLKLIFAHLHLQSDHGYEVKLKGLLKIADTFDVNLTDSSFDYSNHEKKILLTFTIAEGSPGFLPSATGELYWEDSSTPHLLLFGLYLTTHQVHFALPLLGAVPLPLDKAGMLYLSQDCDFTTRNNLSQHWPFSAASQSLKKGVYFPIQFHGASEHHTILMPSMLQSTTPVDLSAAPLRATEDDQPDLTMRSLQDAPFSFKNWLVGHTQWVELQKKFGPVNMQRIGFKLHLPHHLLLALDSTIDFDVMHLDLAGLTVELNLQSPTDVVPYLHGFGLSIQRGSFSLSGEMIRQPHGSNIDYIGGFSCGSAVLSLSAIGSYCQDLQHQTSSLFVFAHVSAELGGLLPFILVTGLAGGFGYHQRLKQPLADQVDQFPLVLMSQESPDASPPNLQNILETLYHDGTVTRVDGERWLAAGVNFTSFGLLNSQALLIMSWGQTSQVNMVGQSNLILPPSYPFVQIDMEFEACLNPQLGIINWQGALSPHSFVIDPQCHLEGAFMVCSWLEPNNHAGDFVVTLGGYHPHFSQPYYYPDIPRLKLNWVLSPPITVKGDAYFALTPACAMGGGQLELYFSQGAIRAWFTAMADFFMHWAPFYYDGNIGVSIGISYDLHLPFVHKTISLSTSASLSLSGPPISGQVHIHLWCVSFSIHFGAPQRPKQPSSLTWAQFAHQFLYKDKQGKYQPLTLECREGLRYASHQHNTLWVVDRHHFVISIVSTIPVTQCNLQHFPSPSNTNLHVRPMDVRLKSVLNLGQISNLPFNPSNNCTITQVLASVPAAQWGHSNNDDNPTTIPNVCTGYIITYSSSLSYSSDLSYPTSDLQYDTITTTFQEDTIPKPIALTSGERDLRKISDTIMESSVVSKRNNMIQALSRHGLFACANRITPDDQQNWDAIAIENTFGQSPVVVPA